MEREKERKNRAPARPREGAPPPSKTPLLSSPTPPPFHSHGIELHPGDVVIDVGAHVGTFAVQAAEAVGAAGKVIALEPTPQTFACLAANAAGHAAFFAAGKAAAGGEGAGCGCGAAGPNATTATTTTLSTTKAGAAAGAVTLASDATSGGRACHGHTATPPPARITPLNLAAGPPGRTSATFTVYHFMAGLATCVPASDEAMEASLAEYVKRAPPLDWRHQVAARAQAWVPSRLFDAGARAFARSVVRPRDVVTCAMAPLSDTLASPAAGLGSKTPIALLKIDVERYELEVMAGTSPSDWARTRQLVFECHDKAAGVAAAKVAGFTRIAVDDGTEVLGPDVQVCTVYCRK